MCCHLSCAPRSRIWALERVVAREGGHPFSGQAVVQRAGGLPAQGGGDALQDNDGTQPGSSHGEHKPATE